jgi:hypothetical protein
MVCSRAERVFVLEHYFASKYSAALHTAFNSAYTNSEVTNKPTIRQIVIEFGTKSNDPGGRFSSRMRWTLLASVGLLCKL